MRRWLLGEALGNDIGRAARRYSVTHLVLPPGAAGTNPEFARSVEGGRLAIIDPRTGYEFWAIPHREWAVFPAEAIAVPGIEAALDAIVRLQREGRRTAVVEAEGEIPTAPGRILEVSRGLEQVRLVAEAEADAVLIVNDAFWPGWRAFIDDAEVPIFAADVLVRAVPWPAGRHALVMRYDPPEVRRGVLLSAAGLASLGGIAFALWRRRSRASRNS
jgi:hypothetical protein